jgi:hypothetical protein
MRRLLGQGNPIQYETKITPGLFGLLDTLKNTHPGIAGTHDDIQRLRLFHAEWHWRSIEGSVSNEQIVKDVKTGIDTWALHAFYFPDPRLRRLTRRIPAHPPPPPTDNHVAHWSDLQKVSVMFDVIKKDRTLSKDLSQDAQGLFSAQNIAIIGAFFTAGFFDGFDAVAAAVGGLWIDWSLVLACCRFGVAVIHASQATNQNEINRAAQKAASSMITFGMVGVLKGIADRGETPGGGGPAKGNAVKDNREPHRVLKNAYREGKVTKENFTNFKTKKIPEESDGGTAAKLMKLGFQRNKIAGIVESGRNFAPHDFTAGEKLYKFTGNGYVPNPKNAYFLDKKGLEDAMGKFGKSDGTWDNWGVKSYLALPCSNLANTITEYSVKSESMGLSSSINPATENYFVDGTDGTLGLPGGGTQLTPGLGTIGNGTPYTP